MALISVIVPVYNVEKYLKRCVDSILSQTYSSFELILVDDGSPDGCGADCDADALADERITVIHHKNRGQGAARNRGVDLSSGDWVHFVDSDDLIHPQMLEILYHSVKNTDAKISMCVYREAQQIPDGFFDAVDYPMPVQTESIDENKLTEYMHDGRTGFYWVVWGKLIFRNLFLSQKIPEGHYYEDNAVAGRWLYMAGKVAIVDYPLYFYQINEAGTTKGINPQKYTDTLWSIKEQLEFCKSVGYKSLAKELLDTFLNKAIGYYWIFVREQPDKKRAELIRRDAVSVFGGNFGLIERNKLRYVFKLMQLFF